MARKLKVRSISKHRTYAIDEIAKALSVHKGTVGRWIRSGELKPVDSGRPVIVHGVEAHRFIKARKPKKQKCDFDQWFCMRCRQPRHAAFCEAEIVSANTASCNVMALCAECATIMHRRFSLSALPQLNRKIDFTVPQALQHLIDSSIPCLNVVLKRGSGRW